MEESMCIGEVCRQADCTPRTVRHYESEQIVTSNAVTLSGRKLYGLETVSIIRTVQLLKRLGCSLKEAREIIALTKSSDTAERRLVKSLRNILAESLLRIDKELDLLTRSRREISDLLAKTEKCRSCSAADCRPCGKLKDLRTLGMLENESADGPSGRLSPNRETE